MDRGVEFLRSRIGNAVHQHRAFLQNLEDHESLADDLRFRDLCTRFIPQMREHQRMLEDYATGIGAARGPAQRAVGALIGAARELADAARESDYLRLVADLLAGRQSEDAFRTFRDAGRALGDHRLAHLGEIGERHHAAYVKDASRLVQQMFVEQVRGVDAVRDGGLRVTEPFGPA